MIPIQRVKISVLLERCLELKSGYSAFYWFKIAQKLLKKGLVFRKVARSCSLTKKLLKILKVPKKLPSRICKGLLLNADNGHFFLAQSTDSHRKSTSLMQTLDYQLWTVIDLSFLKVKRPSVDSTVDVTSATVHRT